MHLRDNLRHTIPKCEAKVMSGTLGTPWLTCKGLLYNFTRRPPVYGRFCAVPYRRVPGICDDGTAYGTALAARRHFGPSGNCSLRSLPSSPAVGGHPMLLIEDSIRRDFSIAAYIYAACFMSSVVFYMRRELPAQALPIIYGGVRTERIRASSSSSSVPHVVHDCSPSSPPPRVSIRANYPVFVRHAHEGVSFFWKDADKRQQSAVDCVALIGDVLVHPGYP
ncbi:hypothetical protein DFH09DRAFT_1103709 [Mycena vulgaris]|nr:hypothetical protein DFH09DRAFT_1103709 [Mycena vulgaris]